MAVGKGDWVRFKVAGRSEEGEVLEVRGPIATVAWGSGWFKCAINLSKLRVASRPQTGRGSR